MIAKSGCLTLAAYTHFGAKGLRGIGMYHLVNEAWKRGYLRKVIAVSKKHCGQDFDLNLVETLPGQSRMIHGLSSIKQKVCGRFPSRLVSEIIFDTYAASRLASRGEIVIMSPGMVSTAKRARALGYKTMVYAAIPEPIYSMKQIEDEKRAFGIRSSEEDRSRSSRIKRFAAQLKVLDYIIALTEFCKQTYIDCGFPRDRIFVTPLGVDLQRFKPAALPPTGNCFTYIFVAHVEGTIGMLKGLQYLLQAWSELKLENSRLLICGKLGDEARQVINKHHDTLRNIELSGPVDNITEYYKQSSVFVFPSVAEGFGKVTLEAMATGRPVIVTPNSGAVARDGIDGFYVPPRDVSALKEKMAFFYHHRDDIQKMGTSAAEQARRFTWERFGLQIADIVQELSSN